MSSSTDIPILQRPDFFDGQQLLAGDLTNVQHYQRELHWLHNRSLHGWGIAFGLAATGARGDRVVHIQPGYALDCVGHDLILSEMLEMPVPAVARASDGGDATYYLTASYADDESLTPETRDGVCGTSGAVRRPEQPVIRWQDPDDTAAESRFRRGLDIILGTIKVRNCQLSEDVSGAARRSAVPVAQPYIASGTTLAGSTVWRFWPDADNPAGVMTTVSTASAGFRMTPRYQAHVVGQRHFAVLFINGSDTAIVDGYAQVVNPASTEFDLVVVLPQGSIRTAHLPLTLNPPEVLTEPFLAKLQIELEWHVVWMGIEE